MTQASTPSQAQNGADQVTLRAVRTTSVDPVKSRPADLLGAVERLRDQVSALALTLEVNGVADARGQRDGLLRQFDDYLLPRLRRMDAPLLAVIGGSTGAGKSTLTNSLVRREVSRSGVLRPTTRSPVLVHHPFDSGAFLSQRILPGLARVTSEGPEPAQPIDVNAPRVTALRLVPDERMSPGLALIDAPDIDSIVDTNRELAVQLLGAADLWVFVTTAARYADAVPWAMLRQAVEQGASVAIVLDRVPEESLQEIRVHFATMLRDRGLASSPVFTVPETELDDEGFLPQPVVQPLFDWLTKLARDHSSRGVVVRRTLGGIVTSLNARVQTLATAAEQQTAADSALRAELRDVFAGGRAAVERELGDGTLLRGDVLVRWQELVGGGEFFKNVETAAGRVRDRLNAAVNGEHAPIADLADALRTGVSAMVESHVQACMEQTTQRWRATTAGAGLLAGRADLDRPASDFGTRLARTVDEWRESVLDLVQIEAQDRKAAGRQLAFGVDGTGVILMLVAVSQAARQAGPGVATGTAEVAERLLDASFGEQTVRSLASSVHADLSERVMRLLDAERTRLENLLNAAGVHVRSAEMLRAGVKAVEEAQ